MNNTITIKKDILLMESKVNNVEMKDGSSIQYVSASVIIKEDNCKLECSVKTKPDEFLKLNLQPYETYSAVIQIDLSDKIKVKLKILSIDEL